MVKTNANILNVKSKASSIITAKIKKQNTTSIAYENFDVNIENNNNNNKGNKDFKPNNKYIKVIVQDPYNNRELILKVTKKQKGVYVWETLDGRSMYVGHSINLYNRISSYFMPSILKTKARRVLRYLNKHSFSNIKLTIYIMDIKSNLDQIIALEQHFIDTLNPNLNVDLLASSSGYHEPMAQKIREKLRKERGTPVYPLWYGNPNFIVHIWI